MEFSFSVNEIQNVINPSQDSFSLSRSLMYMMASLDVVSCTFAGSKVLSAVLCSAPVAYDNQCTCPACHTHTHARTVVAHTHKHTHVHGGWEKSDLHNK